MQLRVFVEKLGRNYPLSPSQEYIVGSGEGSNISLPGFDTISSCHLKLSYDSNSECWYAEDLGSSNGTFIDGLSITRYPIKSETHIRLADSITLTAIPEVIAQSTAIQSIREIANRIPIVHLGFRWFKIGSPADGVGLRLPLFELYQTYRVDREKLGSVCEKLYERVYKTVSDGTLGDAKVRSFIYRKNTLAYSDSRRYILVTRDTVHGNRTTVFIRFLSYGDYLYLGLDVYTLGDLSWWKLLLKISFTGILIAFSWLVFPLFVIPVLWWKLIWRITYENKMGLAFRQEFPGKIGKGPFDYDDVFMFAKSTVHLVVTTIRDVFQEENLPVESLDYFIQNINNITNVDTGGGAINMNNAAIGSSNKVST